VKKKNHFDSIVPKHSTPLGADMRHQATSMLLLMV
jgi:hypothetical protein